MRNTQLGKLLAAILICEGVGVIGLLVTLPAISSWYLYLNKPSFSPPNYAFGPVWTVLYLLMGISLYLIWQMKPNQQTSEAIKWFLAQLTLNLLWSLIFFNGHQIFFAFLDILTLVVALYITIKKFSKLNNTAGYLLIPYLLWTLFATALNFSLLILNR